MDAGFDRAVLQRQEEEEEERRQRAKGKRRVRVIPIRSFQANQSMCTLCTVSSGYVPTALSTVSAQPLPATCGVLAESLARSSDVAVLQKAAQVSDDGEEELDPDMAAMMGFGGFGGSAK